MGAEHHFGFGYVCDANEYSDGIAYTYIYQYADGDIDGDIHTHEYGDGNIYAYCQPDVYAGAGQ